MTAKEVKKIIGRENWTNFLIWMRGQTVGMSVDGRNADYYSHDVYAYKELLDRGYDRQKDPSAWD